MPRTGLEQFGGAGSAVCEALAAHQVQVPLLTLGLPDHFIEHGTREELLAQIGLDTPGVLRSVQKRLRAKDLDESAVIGPQRRES